MSLPPSPAASFHPLLGGQQSIILLLMGENEDLQLHMKEFFFFNSQLYYAAEKKEGIPTFCDSMDGTGDYYAK